MMLATTIALVSTLFQANPSSDRDFECPGMTTYATNMCARQDIAFAEQRLARYVEAAREKITGGYPGEILERFEQSQAAWVSYAENECGAMYESYGRGTIRGIMFAGCRLQLIDERTHTLWQNWLTYADSTPPILPEPDPTPNSNVAR